MLLFTVILRLDNFFGCLKSIINFDFSTLRLSIFYFNQVVIFDISVLILFSIYSGVLRSPKVSSDDISVMSSAYMIKSKREFSLYCFLSKVNSSFH